MPRKAKTGRIEDSHTIMAECPGCGAVLAEIHLTSSGHCPECAFGDAIDRACGTERYYGREDYLIFPAPSRFPAKAQHTPRLSNGVGPAHYLDQGIPRLRDMSLSPNASQDRPLWIYDDVLHLRDDEIPAGCG